MTKILITFAKYLIIQCNKVNKINQLWQYHIFVIRLQQA